MYMNGIKPLSAVPVIKYQTASAYCLFQYREGRQMLSTVQIHVHELPKLEPKKVAI